MKSKKCVGGVGVWVIQENSADRYRRKGDMVGTRRFAKLSKAAKVCVFVVAVVLMLATSAVSASFLSCSADRGADKTQDRTVVQKVFWMAAHGGAGRVAGPAGSAAVGVAEHRDGLTSGPRPFFKSVFKIGAPVAVGIFAGPAGSLSYAAVDQRCWIKKHVFQREQPTSPAPESAETIVW